MGLTTPTSSLDGSVTVRQSRVTLQADVLFAFDSARLGRKAARRIEEATEAIRGV